MSYQQTNVNPEYFKYTNADLNCNISLISVIGPNKSGKTCFIDYILENKINLSKYTPTLGVDYRIGTYNFKGKSVTLLIKEYSFKLYKEVQFKNTNHKSFKNVIQERNMNSVSQFNKVSDNCRDNSNNKSNDKNKNKKLNENFYQNNIEVNNNRITNFGSSIKVESTSLLRSTLNKKLLSTQDDIEYIDNINNNNNNNNTIKKH
jgi:hypothetical protein